MTPPPTTRTLPPEASPDIPTVTLEEWERLA
jgi:hypothetical protein